MNLTLNFDLMTMNLYQILALIDVYPQPNFGFNQTNSIWYTDKKRSCALDGPTDGQTNQPMKQFIEMRQSCRTHLNKQNHTFITDK